MAGRRKKRVTKVTAFLPHSMDLTKLKSSNTLNVEVRSDDELLGTLLLGRGSVQWWPGGNKIYSLRKNWRAFAEMLSQHMGK
jgi:hypothetical protein